MSNGSCSQGGRVRRFTYCSPRLRTELLHLVMLNFTNLLGTIYFNWRDHVIKEERNNANLVWMLREFHTSSSQAVRIAELRSQRLSSV